MMRGLLIWISHGSPMGVSWNPGSVEVLRKSPESLMALEFNLQSNQSHNPKHNLNFYGNPKEASWKSHGGPMEILLGETLMGLECDFHKITL